MDILQKYQTALELYKAKNFDAALKIVEGLKQLAPHWKKPFLLEAYIWRDQSEFVKEFNVLEKLLPRFDLNSPDEKIIFGSVNRDLGLISESVESFRLSAMFEGVGDKACVEISNAIFTANSSENFSAKDFRTLYDDYKKYSADIVPYPKKFYNHKKIRVGFLSANFEWHVVMAWSWDLLNDLDRNLFEVYCYSSVANPDNVTEYFSKTADCWRDIVDLTDEQAAKLIHDDEIDILFDLAGHTKDNRLRIAEYRPATLQISGIGYMNSTGLDCFDYFLSDVHCAANESAMNEYFTEKIIILPQTHFCYNSQIKIDFNEPPCLKNNFVTFGCFNQFVKVTDFILSAWKKILDAVPNSRLLLKHKIFDTADGKNFVYTANVIAEYADMDIALDTFPYTGGVTTCEALYMGVPVISLYGLRHGTRFGLSILKNIGLDVLAVNSVDDYVARAIELAGDWELLTDLRKNLRGMMKCSPLMNSSNYVRAVETAFQKILAKNKIVEYNLR